ncbi:hypothetical protein OG311_38415 (plasmid) [Streptomyces sp. NBC_01343]|uniref:hypothetical protein n=1 Tax=Streptomyces sp. NBC_01343 TaxID=2903832 RepID=UPI002E10D4BA|nr:hypothetical protein OG311_38415 [Streptomyces sp. NBC_01343]
MVRRSRTWGRPDRGRLAQLRKPALPQFINGRRELSAALEYFYEDAGAPPLRRLTELAGGTHLLPVSSAARIVSRQALPASRQQMVAFLTACGVPGHLLGLWGDAFDEVAQSCEIDRRGPGPFAHLVYEGDPREQATCSTC